MFDTIVVGGGPAGMAAAMHASFEGLHTLLISRPYEKCQMCQTSWIENYSGFKKISGNALFHRIKDQCASLGVKWHGANIIDMKPSSMGAILLQDDAGATYEGKTVILALGLQFKPLDIPGACLDGVFNGPYPAYAPHCRGKNVVVVGGANSAGQAVLQLAKYAKRCVLINKHENITSGMSKHLIDEIIASPNIEVCNECLPIAFNGDKHIEEAELNSRTIPCDNAFICVGQEPTTQWIPTTIAIDLDKAGHINTTKEYETRMSNVFAIGDCTVGHNHRISTAVGDGANVVPFILKKLEGNS